MGSPKRVLEQIREAMEQFQGWFSRLPSATKAQCICGASAASRAVHISCSVKCVFFHSKEDYHKSCSQGLKILHGHGKNFELSLTSDGISSHLINCCTTDAFNNDQGKTNQPAE
jgi:hypothetical protein